MGLYYDEPDYDYVVEESVVEENDPELEEELRKYQEFTQRKGGYGTTVLTSGRGATREPGLIRKTLLGGALGTNT